MDGSDVVRFSVVIPGDYLNRYQLAEEGGELHPSIQQEKV